MILFVIVVDGAFTVFLGVLALVQTLFVPAIHGARFPRTL